MDWLIPLVSFIGAFLVAGVVSIATQVALITWDDKRKKNFAPVLALKWRMTVEEIDQLTPEDPKWEQMFEYLLDEYDTKRFSVRFANFLGVLWTVFTGFTYLVMTGLFIGTVLAIVGDGEWWLLHLWWAYPVWIVVNSLLWLAYFQISMLLTGYGPGQPKQQRQEIAEHVTQQRKDYGLRHPATA